MSNTVKAQDVPEAKAATVETSNAPKFNTRGVPRGRFDCYSIPNPDKWITKHVNPASKGLVGVKMAGMHPVTRADVKSGIIEVLDESFFENGVLRVGDAVVCIGDRKAVEEYNRARRQAHPLAQELEEAQRKSAQAFTNLGSSPGSAEELVLKTPKNT